MTRYQNSSFVAKVPCACEVKIKKHASLYLRQISASRAQGTLATKVHATKEAQRQRMETRITLHGVTLHTWADGGLVASVNSHLRRRWACRQIDLRKFRHHERKTTMTDDERRREFCDLTISRAAALMAEAGCPAQQILDRMLTYAAAQAAVLDAAGAAVAFRQIAKQIDAGVFAHLEMQAKVKH